MLIAASPNSTAIATTALPELRKISSSIPLSPIAPVSAKAGQASDGRAGMWGVVMWYEPKHPTVDHSHQGENQAEGLKQAATWSLGVSNTNAAVHVDLSA
jgi:hypothetical protein